MDQPPKKTGSAFARDLPDASLEGPAPVFDTSAPILDPESAADAPVPPARSVPTQGLAPRPAPSPADEEPLELAGPLQQWQPQPEPAPAPAREPAKEPRPPPRPRSVPSRPGSAAPVPRAASGGALPPAALYLLVLGGLAVALALFFYLRPDREAGVGKAPEAAKSAEAADLATTALSVDSAPPGAAVALDGKPTGKLTPVKLAVDSGREHTVELSHPDCFPFKTTFFAAPHETSTVQASLKRGARVSVTSDPAGAQVDLDGKAAFTAPGRSALLAPGRHLLLARLPGMAFDFTELQVLDDEQSEWSAKLVPGVAVKVSSAPEGAAISLDGRATGLVAPAELWVAAGKKHVVRLALEGLQPFSQTLKAAKEGSALKVSGTLQNAKVVELKGELAALEARLAAGERKLERLRSQQSGVVVKDVRKELELKLRIEDLEAELERGQTEAAILREELDKASGSAH